MDLVAVDAAPHQPRAPEVGDGDHLIGKGSGQPFLQQDGARQGRLQAAAESTGEELWHQVVKVEDHRGALELWHDGAEYQEVRNVVDLDNVVRRPQLAKCDHRGRPGGEGEVFPQLCRSPRAPTTRDRQTMDGEPANALRSRLAWRAQADDVDPIATLEQGVGLAFHPNVRVLVVHHHAVARCGSGHQSPVGIRMRSGWTVDYPPFRQPSRNGETITTLSIAIIRCLAADHEPRCHPASASGDSTCRSSSSASATSASSPPPAWHGLVSG